MPSGILYPSPARRLRQAAGLLCLFLCLAGPLASGSKKSPEPESKDVSPPIQWLEISVVYKDGSFLPSDSVLILTLEEVSGADVPVGFLGETIMEVEGEPPYATSLGFKPGLVQDSRRYGLRARILHYDRLLYTNAATVDPFGDDVGSPVEVLVIRVPRDPAP